MRSGGLEIRRAVESDTPAILGVLHDSLGWERDDRHVAYFTWKHRENPFGVSPAWVAVDGSRVAGVRLFLRWEFSRGGEVVRAVRAVDTATHPDYQGRGVFTDLTMGALDDLAREDVTFVFNTPNDQSRPGYLKMGWKAVGRLHVAARPTSARALVTTLRARSPAERWSASSSAGDPARDFLEDRATIAALLSSQPSRPGLATRRSVEYLAWRYASRPIEYRAIAARDRPERGLVLFRVRDRGPARELSVADVLVPDDDARAKRELLRALAKVADADYILAMRPTLAPRSGFVRLPRQGPILTCRPLASGDTPPPLGEWRLRLGDVELL
jgi:hypothetical protein